MLYLKADEPRTLTFEVDIRGVGKADLKGYVRLFINDSEHGFPVSIDDGVITADIPPLTEIIKLKTVEDGDIVEAKLELMTDQHIFTPWEGEVKVSVPMGIKAKLSNETMKPVNTGSPVVAKVVETKEDKEARKKESLNEDFVDLKTSETNEKDYKKDLAELVATTIRNMGLVPANQPEQETLMEDNPQKEKKDVVKESKKEEGKKKLTERELALKKLKNITKEGVFKYMGKAGTKNTMIQELIYDQASAAAGSGEPFEVLKQVVKILNKRK